MSLKVEVSGRDSCLIENVAVCARAFAMVTWPGAESRKGEKTDSEEMLSQNTTAPGG